MRFSWTNLASLSLLLLSGLLWSGVFFASAQGDTESLSTYCEGYQYNTDQLFEDIFEEASVNSNIQIADMFGGNSKNPEIENLYLNIYKMLDESPRNDALQATASQYQYTQTEMCSILGGGLFLLTDTSEKTLSVTELQEIRAEILETYEEEFAKSKREQEMFLDSYGKEIFANGDTSDSSFDLLYDLEVIEYLLFGESTYTTTGGGDLNFTSDEDEDDDDSGDTTDSDSGSGSSSSSGESTEDETDEAAETPDSAEDTEDESTEVFDPASCVADSALQSSLREVLGNSDETEEAANDSDEEPGVDEDEDTTPEETSGSGGSGTSGSDTADGELIVASTPHDWTQPDVCDGIFCLFINFLNDDETDYETSDNCIQCHVDYILEAMKETTGKDLSPGKVSGNLLEPAVCKRSVVEKLTRPAGLTFIAIPMPIATPPADDIVTGISFCEKNRDLIDGENNYDILMSAIFKEQCAEDAEVTSGLTEEENARLQAFGEGLNDEIKAANTRAYGSASVQDLLAEAIPAHESNERALEETFQNSRIESQFSDQASFYELMEQEMAQMNAYFQIFQDLIGNTQTIAEELKNRLETAK